MWLVDWVNQSTNHSTKHATGGNREKKITWTKSRLILVFRDWLSRVRFVSDWLEYWTLRVFYEPNTQLSQCKGKLASLNIPDKQSRMAHIYRHQGLHSQHRSYQYNCKEKRCTLIMPFVNSFNSLFCLLLTSESNVQQDPNKFVLCCETTTNQNNQLTYHTSSSSCLFIVKG